VIGPEWTKSSFSFSNGNCLQVRIDPDDRFIEVRHSQAPDGPVLAFTGPEWDAFTAGVRAGEFDRQKSS
jgi:Domain of unknown function (DUF397)